MHHPSYQGREIKRQVLHALRRRQAPVHVRDGIRELGANEDLPLLQALLHEVEHQDGCAVPAEQLLEMPARGDEHGVAVEQNGRK